MSRRLLVGAVLALTFVLGALYGWQTAFREGSDLLFDSAWYLLVLAPFAGILASGLTRREDPAIDGDRVLRHDGAAMLAHWTHGVGTAVLLATGIALGLYFVPRIAATPQQGWAVMNVHFVAVCFFLFGTFYWATNTLLATKRWREHLPTKDAVRFTVQHYGRLLGAKYDMPPEDKYFESERMAFILALAASGLVILSGFLKAFAHVVDIPGAIMGIATPVHDVATIAMLAFFLAHVFFAAILPSSWPMLRSMFTGYVSVEHAQEEHAGWYRRLASSSQDKRDVA